MVGRLNYALCLLLLLGICAVCVFQEDSRDDIRKNSHPKITIDIENSYFSDFEVENGKVYMYCRITFVNKSEHEEIVKIEAESYEDVKSGLLKDEKLVGFQWEMGNCGKKYKLVPNSDYLILPAASISKYTNVVFVGEYGVKTEKRDRNLPDTIWAKAVNKSEKSRNEIRGESYIDKSWSSTSEN